jgi:photosystem II stability/assembly factor-like uncharacterized protein
MSGRVTSIAGLTIDNQINLYVGTAGGGIWKSMNGGISFSPIFDKYCQSIGALAIDPNASKIIYAGTGESNMRNSVSIGDGIYKSTDGGSNWQKIGLDSTEHISKIIIDPSNSKSIFVSVPGPLWSSSKHRGLYHTGDGGKSWNKILYIDEETGCADIAMSPTNPNVLLATFWKFRRQPFSFNSGGNSSALYKSVDGGKTWKKIEALWKQKCLDYTNLKMKGILGLNLQVPTISLQDLFTLAHLNLIPKILNVFIAPHLIFNIQLMVDMHGLIQSLEM